MRRTALCIVILSLIAGLSFYVDPSSATQVSGPPSFGEMTPLEQLDSSLDGDEICDDFGDAGCRSACRTVGGDWGACDENNTCWCFVSN